MSPNMLFALVDGNQKPPLACAVQCVVGGDGLSLSIAAASIVAKVLRDRAMARLDLRYPGYGWDRNTGYPTPGHRAALGTIGLTCHHRRSFAPVFNLVGTGATTEEWDAEMEWIPDVDGSSELDGFTQSAAS